MAKVAGSVGGAAPGIAGRPAFTPEGVSVQGISDLETCLVTVTKFFPLNIPGAVPSDLQELPIDFDSKHFEGMASLYGWQISHGCIVLNCKPPVKFTIVSEHPWTISNLKTAANTVALSLASLRLVKNAKSPASAQQLLSRVYSHLHDCILALTEENFSLPAIQQLKDNQWTNPVLPADTMVWFTVKRESIVLHSAQYNTKGGLNFNQTAVQVPWLGYVFSLIAAAHQQTASLLQQLASNSYFCTSRLRRLRTAAAGTCSLTKSPSCQSLRKSIASLSIQENGVT